MRLAMMLPIPLRAKLNAPREPVRPKYRPELGFLLDIPQPRLPKLARRRYTPAPGTTKPDNA